MFSFVDICPDTVTTILVIYLKIRCNHICFKVGKICERNASVYRFLCYAFIRYFAQNREFPNVSFDKAECETFEASKISRDFLSTR